MVFKTEDFKYNDLTQVAHQRFSLKKWIAAGARYFWLRKTDSTHCY